MATPPSPRPPPSRSRVALLLLATEVAIAFGHARALAAPLLWDDRTLIPFVTETPLRTLLFTPLANALGSGNPYYRPAALLSLGLESRIFDGNPAALHATNVLLHLVNAGLLFLLLLRRRAPPLAAMACTLLWGLFPRLTEDVSFVSGRMDVLAATLSLAALLAWRTGVLGRRLLAAALLFVGLMSKEVALAAVVAIGLRSALEVSGRSRVDLARRTLWTVAPLGAAALAWVACRAHAGLVAISPVAPEPVSVRLARALEALGTYVLMLLDPLRPRIAIGLRDVRDVRIVVLGAVVFGAGLALTYARRHRLREPHVAEAAALVVLGLVPVLQWVPLQLTALVCDRFLYLPLAGCVLLLAPELRQSTLVRPRRRNAACVLATLMVLAFGIATSFRTGDMQSELRFWSNAFAVERTDAVLVRNNTAAAFTEAHEWRRALLIDETTLRRNDGAGHQADLDKPRHRLVVNLVAAGQPARALELSRRIAHARPFDFAAWQSLVGTSMAARRYDEARRIASGGTGAFGGVAERMLQDIDEMEHTFGEPTSALTAAQTVARARFLRRLGAEEEADAAWLGAIAKRDLSPAQLREAISDILEAGSYDTILRARELAGDRLDRDGDRGSIDILTDLRRAERQAADAAWQRIVESGRME